MSAKPGEELGSDGRWFSDEYERNGLFGGEQKASGGRGGEAAGDLDQQLHPFQDDGKRPPVAMETASTGKMGSCRIKVLICLPFWGGKKDTPATTGCLFWSASEENIKT